MQNPLLTRIGLIHMLCVNIKMRFEISDNLLLQIYGVGLLIISSRIWFNIPFWTVCLIIWPLGLIAIIIYHRKLQNVKLLTSKWTFAIWLSLFFPKLSDPFLTNLRPLISDPRSSDDTAVKTSKTIKIFLNIKHLHGLNYNV